MNQRQFVLLSIVQSVLLLFCIFGLCGCSALGFGIGALIDGGKPDKEILQAGATMNLKPGDEIRIFLLDSTVVQGAYKESVPLDSATYAGRYGRFLQGVRADDLTFPALGDTLFSHTNADRLPSRYVFRGFRSGSVKLYSVDESRTISIPLAQLTTLKNHDGKMLPLGMLERMNRAGQLPSDVSLVVQGELGTSHLPMNDIEHIEKANSKHALLIGLGVGLAVDVAVVIVVVSVLDSFGGGISFR